MKSKPFIGAVVFLGFLFVLSPLYSLARDRYEEHEEEYHYSYEEEDDDDGRYEYAAPVQQVAVPQVTPDIDTSTYDTAEQQLNAQHTALEARRKQLEQQGSEQQKFAEQLSGIEQQLNAQRKTLEAKAQELAQRKTEQDAISRQLDALERQLSSGTQAYNVHYPTDGSVAYTVTDSNFNGISDILEGLTRISLR